MLKNFHWLYGHSRSGLVVRTLAVAEAGMLLERRKAESAAASARRGLHHASPLFVSFDVYVEFSLFLHFTSAHRSCCILSVCDRCHLSCTCCLIIISARISIRIILVYSVKTHSTKRSFSLSLCSSP